MEKIDQWDFMIDWRGKSCSISSQEIELIKEVKEMIDDVPYTRAYAITNFIYWLDRYSYKYATQAWKEVFDEEFIPARHTAGCECKLCGKYFDEIVLTHEQCWDIEYSVCEECIEKLDSEFVNEKLNACIKELNNVAYREYLKSNHWNIVRNNALKRAGNKCQLCGSKKRLQVHHNTYENRGNEKPEDLVVLCSQCHQIFHDKGIAL